MYSLNCALYDGETCVNDWREQYSSKGYTEYAAYVAIAEYIGDREEDGRSSFDLRITYDDGASFAAERKSAQDLLRLLEGVNFKGFDLAEVTCNGELFEVYISAVEDEWYQTRNVY